jgi:hypothetical protein
MSVPLPPVVPASARTRQWTSFTVLAAVVAVSCLVGAITYRHFLSDHRSLWYSTDHDRNAHYLYALKLASALRTFNVVEFLHEINRAYMWPPLHGLLLSPLLAIEGFDYRLAVLPSLLGWAGTAIVAFLLARRCLPESGELAGLVAATLVLASPLHRGFATDVMLESLGACLTLLTLYLYVRTVQDGQLSLCRWLAMCLTAFFLHKYNYWLLTVFALVGAELTARGTYYARTMRSLLSYFDWRAVVRRELRQPLTWMTAVSVLLVLVILLSGVRSLHLSGRTIRTHPPTALISLGYLFALLRILWWAWSNRAWIKGWDARLQVIVYWHLFPLVLFLALPRHFATFLFFVSPANGSTEQSSLWNGIQFYVPAAVQHYHVAAWSAFVICGLFFVAVASWRRLRPGASAVLLLVLISAFLTCLHGNRQVRFLHTWIPAFWVSAGIGAVIVASLLARPFAQRHSTAVVGLAMVAMIGLHAPSIILGKTSSIGGPWAGRPSMLEVSDAICQETATTKSFTILTTIPFRFFSQWVFLEHADAGGKFESHWWGYGQPERANRDGFLKWLQSSRCDTFVFVDGRPPDTSGMNVEVQRHSELREQIVSQKTFQLVKERDFPGQGCRLMVYRRAERN